MRYVVVLTATGGVADSTVRDIADAMGLDASPRRLSPDAVEVPCETRPARADVPGIDVNVVPAADRRKRLLLADMDSTIIPVECIDELADFAGLKPRVAEITERAMRGEIDFQDALRERVVLLAGLTRADIEACYQERVSLNPGAETLIRTMNATGAFTALVSGGFTVFTSRVAERAGFQLNRANTLMFEGDRLTGAVGEPIVDASTKLATLKELTSAHGIKISQTVAVGDGANDAPMIAAAGLGVAYKAKPALREVADAVLDYSDLSAILALQGIPSSQYAN